MQAIKQLGGGLLLGLISLAVVIGGISLALAEGYVPQPALYLASDTPGPTSLPTSDISTSYDFLLTPFPSDTPVSSATPVPPTNCPPPAGWILISVGPGETLDSLAARYRVSAAALQQANCLLSASLLPGYGIYVPPLPTSTPIPCGAPAGWIQYSVQPGDTLFHISQLFRVTVQQLQRANCLGSSSLIYTGQKLWVPNVPTSTPAVTATIITIEFATSTPMPSDTPTPTSTPTATNTTAPSATPVTPTNTSPPSQTSPPPTSTSTPPTP